MDIETWRREMVVKKSNIIVYVILRSKEKYFKVRVYISSLRTKIQITRVVKVNFLALKYVSK